MSTVPTVQRVMAASVRIADRAAEIIRGILRAGDLGIVQKTVRCGMLDDAVALSRRV